MTSILSQPVTQWTTSQPERFKSSVPSLQDSTGKRSFSSLSVTLTQNLCLKQQGHKDKNHVIPLIRINFPRQICCVKRASQVGCLLDSSQRMNTTFLNASPRNNCFAHPKIGTMGKHGSSLSSTHHECKVSLHLGFLDMCTF